MKKLLFTLTLIISFMGSTFAQFDIQNLEGGVRLGYAKPIGDFSEFAKGGLTYNAFVGYKLNEKLSVGIEYGATIAAAVNNDTISGFSLTAFGLSNYLAKGTYKFTEDSDFVPYASVGLGVAIVENPSVTINGVTSGGETKVGFGANAELGFAFKGFNLAYAFNVGGNAPTEQTDGEKLSVNYHSFLIGYIYNF